MWFQYSNDASSNCTASLVCLSHWSVICFLFDVSNLLDAVIAVLSSGLLISKRVGTYTGISNSWKNRTKTCAAFSLFVSVHKDHVRIDCKRVYNFEVSH